MFTGLIEEIGTLLRVGRHGEAMTLTIGASRILERAAVGDSIAVNGVCLTATAIGGSSFTVDVTPQTYRHTNLGRLRPGGRVNLERAMRADGRFGGHIVQGHADGTATIVSRENEANAVNYGIRPTDAGLMRYIIPQGSVAVDGISLTVARVEGGTFYVSIIPHTLAETALQDKGPGDTVNIETDILGKYVDHLLRFGGAGRETEGRADRTGGVTAAFLAEHGFM